MQPASAIKVVTSGEPSQDDPCESSEAVECISQGWRIPPCPTTSYRLKLQVMHSMAKFFASPD